MRAISRGWLTAITVTALSAGLVLTACAYANAEGRFERTLTVTGPVQLDVQTGSGYINVRAGEPGVVRVVGTIKASRAWWGGGQAPEEKVRALEANPPIVQNGNIVRIGHIEDKELRRNVSISYDLVVPAETRLKSDTGSGHQTIQGIRGPVDANTGSGDLEISHIGGEVRADTGSGHIELTTVQGSVHADTGSGHIMARGVAGSFWADTGSGSVQAELTAPGQVVIDTGSGSVEVRGVRGSVQVDTGSGSIEVAGEPTGNWRLEAGSGSITVRLPAQAAFDLDARTSSGRIHSDHPITIQGSVGKREIRGKVRGGGTLISAQTGSGNITIE